MSTENLALARRVIDEVFNAGKLDVIDELVTDDYVGHDPALPADQRGPEAAKGSVAGYRAAFPDLHITIEDQLAGGDLVATRWTGRGTHQGELMGMPATGKQSTVTGITIDKIVNGRIAESWTNWDTLGMLQQLGAVPALSTA
jgi:steroid delta-isomerase-like uncharacterized protein